MATVFPVMSISVWSTLDGGGGILANAATHKSQLITWALLNLVGGVAAAGVAFMFYPILKRAVDTSVEKGLARLASTRGAGVRAVWSTFIRHGKTQLVNPRFVVDGRARPTCHGPCSASHNL